MWLSPFVSIPNGMEFYLDTAIVSFLNRLFQFPTGWNFTAQRIEMRAYIFSFNSQRDGILLCDAKPKEKTEESFNSQRDGILLCRGIVRELSHIVSIPNGMEFYSALWRGYL